MPYFHPDQFPQEFVERVTQAHAPRQFGETGFSASAVEAMSPEEHRFVMQHAAAVQRGTPERVMHDVQRATGGGAFSYLAEHIGDLTHRLNDQPTIATELAAPKVSMGLSTLANRADIRDLEATHSQVGTVAQRYAEAHQQVPVYNEPSYHGRQAAISIGRGDFSTAALHLRSLHDQMSDPDKFKYLLSQQGSVDFLRRQEERGY